MTMMMSEKKTKEDKMRMSKKRMKNTKQKKEAMREGTK